MADAARVMQLSQQQVRRLASSGALPARRFPGGWLLDEQAVRRRAHNAPPAGRPLSAGMSWLLLRALSDRMAPVHQADALPGMEDRRVRYRLRQLATTAPPFEQWPYWLRRRAGRRRVWVHPGLVERLAHDERIHSWDDDAVSAAVGLTASDLQRFYLRLADVASVMADYRVIEDPGGQVDLMLVPGDAADAFSGGARTVPVAASLVDMLESPDARKKHAAAQSLGDALSRLLARS